MNRRSDIQKQHERSLIQSFLEWFNSELKSNYVVIDEPDPPEAIIRDGNDTTWIEVADAFHSDEFAKDLYSYATPGEDHQPMPSGPHFQMDSQFTYRFISVLKKKLGKKSYLPFKEKFGPGQLIICIQHSWFDAGTVEEMKELCKSEDWSDDLGCFDKILISFSSMNKRVFKLWPDEV